MSIPKLKDLLSEAFINKVNNAFSASDTFVTLNGVTSSLSETKSESKFRYITASFLPQFSGLTQTRLFPEIIFETTKNRDFKVSDLSLTSSKHNNTGNDTFFFRFTEGNRDREVTIIQKFQNDLIIPSIDGLIPNTDLYNTFGSQQFFEGFIDNQNIRNQSGETLVLEGEVNSPFIPETVLYHVSKSDDGNAIKDGNKLVSGKVFAQIDKKQSKHYNIGIKKFFVHSNHPSGSGVKFGSAFLYHERTQGADVNLPSETPLRRVFFEGVKLKSDGPVNINSEQVNSVNGINTIDSGPVVEVNIVSPTTILVSEPGSSNNLTTNNDYL